VQLTFYGGYDDFSKWSPDDVTIAFASQRSGSSGAWLVPSTGGAAAQVPTGLSGDHHVAWSPDGSSLAFDAYSGPPYIWTITLDGGAVVRYSETPGIHPCWSPAGDAVCFASVATGDEEIYVATAQGSGDRQLTSNSATDHHPAWSPDGTTIAYASDVSGDWNVLLIPAAGGPVLPLTTDTGRDDFPSWSPDGLLIAFTSDRSGYQAIWVKPLAGGEAVQVTFGGNDWAPDWSHDGRVLSFTSTRSGNPDIWLVSLDWLDGDQDGIWDVWDNCPDDFNPTQCDSDWDGVGDACCCGHHTGGYTGNTDCSTDGKRNLSDITRLIDHVYIEKTPLCCPASGNTSGDAEGKINLSDITALIDHVYISELETADCE